MIMSDVRGPVEQLTGEQFEFPPVHRSGPPGPFVAYIMPASFNIIIIVVGFLY